MISYLYHKKHNKKEDLKEYEEHSKKLNKDSFDRYWLFIYETLPSTALTGHYQQMKEEKLTFIKKEFN